MKIQPTRIKEFIEHNDDMGARQSNQSDHQLTEKLKQ
jgi:hypothetical protein